MATDNKMADIRVQVQESYMLDLRQKMGLKSYPEVIQEALTLLSWAVEERGRERLILSTGLSGHEVERLAMRSLSAVKPLAARAA